MTKLAGVVLELGERSYSFPVTPCTYELGRKHGWQCLACPIESGCLEEVGDWRQVKKAVLKAQGKG